MKSIDQITNEIVNHAVFTTSYERTKIIVIVSRILDKPWMNHRLELNLYSIRYKASDKTIFVYGKTYEFDENYDFDYIDEIEFPTNFNVKIIVEKNTLIKILKFNIRRLKDLWMKII